MHDLKTELQAHDGEEYDENHKKKAVDALKRMENWNLFSDTYEDFQNYTVARDSFLANLGATLWSSMRHVIAPSFADGAYHYYETISFQLFFVTQEKLRDIKHLPVNLKALQEGLSSLMVPSQKVMFSTQLRPIKAAIASAAEHPAGLIPLHLVYSQAHETAIEISHFQTDSVARSYIITSLEESIQAVNEAIHLLLMERTTEQGFKVFKAQERALVEKYNSVVGLWRRISTMSGDLRYGDAKTFTFA